uniref:Uncharacterized protein n=1 Tax=Ralstonia solanacearum TaxID=305 RepID=A0A0S4UAY4_RALSL|nr:conserved protein of unknown function [Ralstonia solanacearum]
MRCRRAGRSCTRRCRAWCWCRSRRTRCPTGPSSFRTTPRSSSRSPAGATPASTSTCSRSRRCCRATASWCAAPNAPCGCCIRSATTTTPRCARSCTGTSTRPKTTGCNAKNRYRSTLHAAQPDHPRFRHRPCPGPRPGRRLHRVHGRDRRRQVHPDRRAGADARRARRCHRGARGRAARRHHCRVRHPPAGARLAGSARATRRRRHHPAAPHGRCRRPQQGLHQRRGRHAGAVARGRRTAGRHPRPACAPAAAQDRCPAPPARCPCGAGRRGARGRRAVSRMAGGGPPARGGRAGVARSAARARARGMAGQRIAEARPAAGRVGRSPGRASPPVARGQPDRGHARGAGYAVRSGQRRAHAARCGGARPAGPGRDRPGTGRRAGRAGARAGASPGSRAFARPLRRPRRTGSGPAGRGRRTPAGAAHHGAQIPRRPRDPACRADAAAGAAGRIAGRLRPGRAAGARGANPCGLSASRAGAVARASQSRARTGRRRDRRHAGAVDGGRAVRDRAASAGTGRRGRAGAGGVPGRRTCGRVAASAGQGGLGRRTRPDQPGDLGDRQRGQPDPDADLRRGRLRHRRRRGRGGRPAAARTGHTPPGAVRDPPAAGGGTGQPPRAGRQADRGRQHALRPGGARCHRPRRRDRPHAGRRIADRHHAPPRRRNARRGPGASGARAGRAAEIPARGPVIAYTDNIAARITVPSSGEPTFQPQGEFHGPTGCPIPFLAVVRPARAGGGTGPVPAGCLQVGAGD